MKSTLLEAYSWFEHIQQESVVGMHIDPQHQFLEIRVCTNIGSSQAAAPLGIHVSGPQHKQMSLLHRISEHKTMKSEVPFS